MLNTVCVNPLYLLSTLYVTHVINLHHIFVLQATESWVQAIELLYSVGRLTFVLSATLLQCLVDHFRHWISYHLVTS